MKDRLAGDRSGALEHVDTKDGPSEGIWNPPQGSPARSRVSTVHSSPEGGREGLRVPNLGSVRVDSALVRAGGSEQARGILAVPFQGPASIKAG